MQPHPLLGNYLTWVIKQLSGSVQPRVEYNQQLKDERLFWLPEPTNPLWNIF